MTNYSETAALDDISSRYLKSGETEHQKIVIQEKVEGQVNCC